MPVVLQRYPIAYYATPKVACTSIKLALYHLEHGKPFERWRDQNGTVRHIHNSWEGSPKFTLLSTPHPYYKFSVVRDPLERFLSAFANRVIQYRELDEPIIQSLDGDLGGLQPNPSLSEFISKLELYRAASAPIRHHTDPQSFFIGKDLSYYDRVFRFNELDLIVGELKDAVGAQITLPHEQRGGLRISAAELSGNERRRILDFYAEDYFLLNEILQSTVG
jgi:hypothetical protein